MSWGACEGYGGDVARFMLSHRHSERECRAAYAAWNGFESPLRHHEALSSCGRGGHRIFWTVEARDEPEALAQLPPYLAARTEVSEVREVAIP
jgi:hypothetical protein